MRQKRPDLDDGAIIEAYNDGGSLETLAEQFGAAYSTIRYRLRKADVSMRPQHHLRIALDIEAVSKAYNDGESLKTLAEQFDVSPGTIRRRLRKADVCIRPPSKQARQLDLNATQRKTLRSIVDGGVLGDATITPSGVFRISQTKSRFGWVKEIQGKLNRLGVASTISRYSPRTGVINGHLAKGNGGYLLCTMTYVEFRNEYRRWYPKGKKRVPADVDLSRLSLTYWFCGDGCGTDRGGLHFATNSFLKREVEHLATGLTQRGVEARCYKLPQHRQWVVVVTKRGAAQTFKDLVGPLTPKCCQYKLRHVRPLLSFEERAEQRRRLKYKDVNRLRVLRKKGWTLSALAAEFGMSGPSIHRYLNR